MLNCQSDAIIVVKIPRDDEKRGRLQREGVLESALASEDINISHDLQPTFLFCNRRSKELFGYEIMDQKTQRQSLASQSFVNIPRFIAQNPTSPEMRRSDLSSHNRPEMSNFMNRPASVSVPSPFT